MTTEPEMTTPRLAMVPTTGELVDLRNAPVDALAEWRVRAVEIVNELRAFSSDLDQELARRYDFDANQVKEEARAAGFKLEIPSAMVDEWDVDRLGIVLQSLVEDGRISKATAANAFRTKIERTVDKRHLGKLLRHSDEEVRESVARCQSTVANTARRATVRLAHDR